MFSTLHTMVLNTSRYTYSFSINLFANSHTDLQGSAGSARTCRDLQGPTRIFKDLQDFRDLQGPARICRNLQRSARICNRLLWVSWYRGYSNYPPYWNSQWPSFAQNELIKPRERPWKIGSEFQYGNKYYTCNINSLRGAVAHFYIAQTHIYLRFPYCLNETISQYKGAPACFL